MARERAVHSNSNERHTSTSTSTSAPTQLPKSPVLDRAGYLSYREIAGGPTSSEAAASSTMPQLPLSGIRWLSLPGPTLLPKVLEHPGFVGDTTTTKISSQEADEQGSDEGLDEIETDRIDDDDDVYAFFLERLEKHYQKHYSSGLSTGSSDSTVMSTSGSSRQVTRTKALLQGITTIISDVRSSTRTARAAAAAASLSVGDGELLLIIGDSGLLVDYIQLLALLPLPDMFAWPYANQVNLVEGLPMQTYLPPEISFIPFKVWTVPYATASSTKINPSQWTQLMSISDIIPQCARREPITDELSLPAPPPTVHRTHNSGQDDEKTSFETTVETLQAVVSSLDGESCHLTSKACSQALMILRRDEGMANQYPGSPTGAGLSDMDVNALRVLAERKYLANVLEQDVSAVTTSISHLASELKGLAASSLNASSYQASAFAYRRPLSLATRMRSYISIVAPGRTARDILAASRTSTAAVGIAVARGIVREVASSLFSAATSWFRGRSKTEPESEEEPPADTTMDEDELAKPHEENTMEGDNLNDVALEITGATTVHAIGSDLVLRELQIPNEADFSGFSSRETPTITFSTSVSARIAQALHGAASTPMPEDVSQAIQNLAQEPQREESSVNEAGLPIILSKATIRPDRRIPWVGLFADTALEDYPRYCVASSSPAPIRGAVLRQLISTVSAIDKPANDDNVYFERITVSQQILASTSPALANGTNYIIQSDSLGRVVMLDTSTLSIVRDWKGYRGAQFAWLQGPLRSSCSQYVQLRSKSRHDHGTSGGNPADMPCQVQDAGLFVMIHLPRLGLVEVWPVPDGPRIAVANVGTASRLVVAEDPAYHSALVESLVSYIRELRGMETIRKQLTLSHPSPHVPFLPKQLADRSLVLPASLSQVPLILHADGTISAFLLLPIGDRLVPIKATAPQPGLARKPSMHKPRISQTNQAADSATQSSTTSATPHGSRDSREALGNKMLHLGRIRSQIQTLSMQSAFPALSSAKSTIELPAGEVELRYILEKLCNSHPSVFEEQNKPGMTPRGGDSTPMWDDEEASESLPSGTTTCNPEVIRLCELVADPESLPTQSLARVLFGVHLGLVELEDSNTYHGRDLAGFVSELFETSPPVFPMVGYPYIKACPGSDEGRHSPSMLSRLPIGILALVLRRVIARLSWAVAMGHDVAESEKLLSMSRATMKLLSAYCLAVSNCATAGANPFSEDSIMTMAPIPESALDPDMFFSCFVFESAHTSLDRPSYRLRLLPFASSKDAFPPAITSFVSEVFSGSSTHRNIVKHLFALIVSELVGSTSDQASGKMSSPVPARSAPIVESAKLPVEDLWNLIGLWLRLQPEAISDSSPSASDEIRLMKLSMRLELESYLKERRASLAALNQSLISRNIASEELESMSDEAVLDLFEDAQRRGWSLTPELSDPAVYRRKILILLKWLPGHMTFIKSPDNVEESEQSNAFSPSVLNLRHFLRFLSWGSRNQPSEAERTIAQVQMAAKLAREILATELEYKSHDLDCIFNVITKAEEPALRIDFGDAENIAAWLAEEDKEGINTATLEAQVNNLRAQIVRQIEDTRATWLSTLLLPQARREETTEQKSGNRNSYLATGCLKWVIEHIPQVDQDQVNLSWKSIAQISKLKARVVLDGLEFMQSDQVPETLLCSKNKLRLVYYWIGAAELVTDALCEQLQASPAQEALCATVYQAALRMITVLCMDDDRIHEILKQTQDVLAQRLVNLQAELILNGGDAQIGPTFLQSIFALQLGEELQQSQPFRQHCAPGTDGLSHVPLRFLRFHLSLARTRSSSHMPPERRSRLFPYLSVGTSTQIPCYIPELQLKMFGTPDAESLAPCIPPFLLGVNPLMYSQRLLSVLVGKLAHSKDLPRGLDVSLAMARTICHHTLPTLRVYAEQVILTCERMLGLGMAPELTAGPSPDLGEVKDKVAQLDLARASSTVAAPPVADQTALSAFLLHESMQVSNLSLALRFFIRSINAFVLDPIMLRLFNLLSWPSPSSISSGETIGGLLIKNMEPWIPSTLKQDEALQKLRDLLRAAEGVLEAQIALDNLFPALAAQRAQLWGILQSQYDGYQHLRKMITDVASNGSSLSHWDIRPIGDALRRFFPGGPELASIFANQSQIEPEFHGLVCDTLRGTAITSPEEVKAAQYSVTTEPLKVIPCMARFLRSAEPHPSQNCASIDAAIGQSVLAEHSYMHLCQPQLVCTAPGCQAHLSGFKQFDIRQLNEDPSALLIQLGGLLTSGSRAIASPHLTCPPDVRRSLDALVWHVFNLIPRTRVQRPHDDEKGVHIQDEVDCQRSDGDLDTKLKIVQRAILTFEDIAFADGEGIKQQLLPLIAELSATESTSIQLEPLQRIFDAFDAAVQTQSAAPDSLSPDAQEIADLVMNLAPTPHGVTTSQKSEIQTDSALVAHFAIMERLCASKDNAELIRAKHLDLRAFFELLKPWLIADGPEDASQATQHFFGMPISLIFSGPFRRATVAGQNQRLNVADLSSVLEGLRSAAAAPSLASRLPQGLLSAYQAALIWELKRVLDGKVPAENESCPCQLLDSFRPVSEVEVLEGEDALPTEKALSLLLSRWLLKTLSGISLRAPAQFKNKPAIVLDRQHFWNLVPPMLRALVLALQLCMSELERGRTPDLAAVADAVADSVSATTGLEGWHFGSSTPLDILGTESVTAIFITAGQVSCETAWVYETGYVMGVVGMQHALDKSRRSPNIEDRIVTGSSEGCAYMQAYSMRKNMKFLRALYLASLERSLSMVRMTLYRSPTTCAILECDAESTSAALNALHGSSAECPPIPRKLFASPSLLHQSCLISSVVRVMPWGMIAQPGSFGLDTMAYRLQLLREPLVFDPRPQQQSNALQAQPELDLALDSFTNDGDSDASSSYQGLLAAARIPLSCAYFATTTLAHLQLAVALLYFTIASERGAASRFRRQESLGGSSSRLLRKEIKSWLLPALTRTISLSSWPLQERFYDILAAELLLILAEFGFDEELQNLLFLTSEYSTQSITPRMPPTRVLGIYATIASILKSRCKSRIALLKASPAGTRSLASANVDPRLVEWLNAGQDPLLTAHLDCEGRIPFSFVLHRMPLSRLPQDAQETEFSYLLNLTQMFSTRLQTCVPEAVRQSLAAFLREHPQMNDRVATTEMESGSWWNTLDEDLRKGIVQLFGSTTSSNVTGSDVTQDYRATRCCSSKVLAFKDHVNKDVIDEELLKLCRLVYLSKVHQPGSLVIEPWEHVKASLYRHVEQLTNRSTLSDLKRWTSLNIPEPPIVNDIKFATELQGFSWIWFQLAASRLATSSVWSSMIESTQALPDTSLWSGRSINPTFVRRLQNCTALRPLINPQGVGGWRINHIDEAFYMLTVTAFALARSYRDEVMTHHDHDQFHTEVINATGMSRHFENAINDICTQLIFDSVWDLQASRSKRDETKTSTETEERAQTFCLLLPTTTRFFARLTVLLRGLSLASDELAKGLTRSSEGMRQ